jgi:hypothetical protein
MSEKIKGRRGRPAMDCKIVNEKTFQRKKEETIKKAQLKKCASRTMHPVKPCAIKDNKCVSSSSAVKKMSCGSVKPKPIGTFKNKSSQKEELFSRCTKMGLELNKKCTVPNTKKLVCHDSKLKNKKPTGEFIPGIIYK